MGLNTLVIYVCDNLAGIAVIEIMIDSVHAGWTFTILAGLITLCSPVFVVLWKKGRGWRLKREKRLKEKKESGSA